MLIAIPLAIALPVLFLAVLSIQQANVVIYLQNERAREIIGGELFFSFSGVCSPCRSSTCGSSVGDERKSTDSCDSAAHRSARRFARVGRHRSRSRPARLLAVKSVIDILKAWSAEQSATIQTAPPETLVPLAVAGKLK